MEKEGNANGETANMEYRQRMRQYRTVSGLTHARLAPLIPCSESLVGAVERGTRPPTEPFTRGLERVFGLDGELLELLPAIRDVNPVWFRKWPAIEAAARSIRIYQLAVIPGLLQTADYARAVFEGEPGAMSGEVEKAIKARLQRQIILSQANPPSLSVILDESVLLRCIGGPEVMTAQLAYLLDMMARPYVTVRIVPLSARSTAGLIGPFVLASDDGTNAAFLENAETGEVIHQIEVMHKLNQRWELLSGLAQPTYETIKIIKRVMEA
ncbi:helix-turn-helix domain-containing protein [Nonomuraea glycinis]|uniref:Transcriptional regulator n=1 Tax=Nonomuraea glycinis TaxID=2047744 RepID=A0A918ACU3_9ACTN|nr:helix-turn-helix transcriptional regulator [Nonomuraea glycinis]MCA2178234.1 helix-turn-helix domain-containing protein [Nonomuraea glycinis]GGP12685.1 transcriptional regulator [Nonomuraea glycinis]